MDWLWEVCSLAWPAIDAEFMTNSICSPTPSKLYRPEVYGSMFPLSFSNQISLAGHSSAVLSLAMPFYFNGTSFVRLTRKASVSCSEPAGHESSPNWERAGILRGAQNLSWQPWTRGGCALLQHGRNLLCLHGHDLRNIYMTAVRSRGKGY